MGRKRLESRTTDAAAVASYKHRDKRKRIPTQEESVKLSAREKQPVKKRYDYDPSLDPQLVWSGKKEAGSELSVSTVPIYVQEKIAPEAIVARLKQGAKDEMQLTLFGETTQQQFDKAVEFYKHEDNWQNRMILGDSLLVMNSLLEKEGMRGKVQTIYIDPPYGIKFGSNWQVSTRKRDVKDNKIDDWIRQPEQVKAFRDTWELGIHSYLSYLRDRLIVARELLNESGSCFVQISDENIHLVRAVLDEVFLPHNQVATIVWKKGTPDAKAIRNAFNYLLWYSKDIDSPKVRKLFLERSGIEGTTEDPKKLALWGEFHNGEVRTLTSEEKRDIYSTREKARVFRVDKVIERGDDPERYFKFDFGGEKLLPKKGYVWRGSPEQMAQLLSAGRLVKTKEGLGYKFYMDDFPVIEITNFWDDTGGRVPDMVYVVQTHDKIIERCVLMTTDPGDLVFDPTCGAGTTAYVAEKWGRRWITTDTSRVALALARTRLMTSQFPYYSLKDKNNLNIGFEYRTVPHITLKSVANNVESEQEVLYDQPKEDKNIVRVSGPFTVESLSPHRVSDAQEVVSSDRFVETIVANLLKAGVQTGEKGARVEFVNLDILPGGPEIQASGEYKTAKGLKKVAVAIGPEFGSVDDDFIRDAAKVAKKFADLLVVAATSFEASAFTEPSELDKLRIMKVKINPDLSMGDLLKKTGSANLFLAFGDPDVKVKQTKEGIIVEILGVDIYDPVKSEIRSSGSGDPEHEIAAWFIDTNYNGEAFFVTHAYFLGADKPYEKLKKALKADIKEDAWDDLYSTVSRPFSSPKTGKIAVKVINHYGDEVMKVIELKKI
ncbi:MAG TPA: site-specific DNA-methyltransferase [Candidatus Omnitrophota bacterium]|nr:site-specific DNA-methyltransferase [Candidatus Omnitrophota bacterium]